MASGATTATVHRSPAAIAVPLEVRSEAMSRCTRTFTPCEARAKAQRGGAAEVDGATSADAKQEGGVPSGRMIVGRHLEKTRDRTRRQASVRDPPEGLGQTRHGQHHQPMTLVRMSTFVLDDGLQLRLVQESQRARADDDARADARQAVGDRGRVIERHCSKERAPVRRSLWFPRIETLWGDSDPPLRSQSLVRRSASELTPTLDDRSIPEHVEGLGGLAIG
jgi:hypothetical protein